MSLKLSVAVLTPWELSLTNSVADHAAVLLSNDVCTAMIHTPKCGMDRTHEQSCSPIYSYLHRDSNCISEYDVATMLTLLAHHRRDNLQRYILNHGPAESGSARFAASLLLPPDSTAPMPASFSQLHSEQPSDAARPVVPVQRCADSGHPSPSFGRPAIRPGSLLPVDFGYP